MSTEKPRPLQGYREVQETKKDVPVDPKKFQEELSKVQQSDESQQQGKRNLKKSETEIEDDEEKNEAPIEASGELFSLFMSDEDHTSVMSPQTPQNIRSTQAPSSSSSFNIEEESPSSGVSGASPSSAPPEAPLAGLAPSFPQVSSPIASSGSSFSDQQAPQEQLPSPPSISTQPSLSQDAPPSYSTVEQPQATSAPQASTQEVSDDSSPQRVKKKEVQDTSLLAGKKPSSAQVLKKKKETTPEIKLEKAPKEEVPLEKKPSTTAPEKPPEKKPPVIGAKPLSEAPTKTSITEKKPEVSQQAKETYLQKEAIPEKVSGIKAPLTTPLVDDKKKLDEKGKEQPLTEKLGSSGLKAETSSRDHKDKQDEKETENSATVSQTTNITPFTPTPQSTPAPAYATLPTQVYELFERMIGVMTVEQHKGITTTTVTINMKDSVFNGAQIILDHYSSAPNSFNLTIAGSPQAQEMINANIDDLAAAFQQSKLSFEVNLRKPILLQEHQAFKRKEKVGEEDQKQKNQ